MNLWTSALHWHVAAARVLDHLRSPLLLVARLWVGWQFLVSGWLKLTTWDTTVVLFENEYRTPMLPPLAAAMAGTFGEIFFPALLMLGLFGRFAALGLFAVNLVAVVSYWHVLGSEGYEAALAQHVLWGFMILVLLVCGVGTLSMDRLLEPRATRT